MDLGAQPAYPDFSQHFLQAYTQRDVMRVMPRKLSINLQQI